MQDRLLRHRVEKSEISTLYRFDTDLRVILEDCPKTTGRFATTCRYVISKPSRKSMRRVIITPINKRSNETRLAYGNINVILLKNAARTLLP